MKNRLGIKGWVFAGRSNFERYLYTLHRITGFILIFYLFAHIIVTGTRIFGQEAWDAVIGRFTKIPVVIALEYVLVAVLIFHALNGLRLIITEAGFLVGRAKRPVYPYVASSLSRPRLFIFILILLGLAILIIGFFEFFIIKL